MKYPEQYLHIQRMQDGEEWIVPLDADTPLCLKALIGQWIKAEFCGELMLDGEIMPSLEGEYYGRIMTDGRPPDAVVCWDGAGFYVKAC